MLCDHHHPRCLHSDTIQPRVYVKVPSTLIGHLQAELEAAGIYSKSSSSHHTPAAAGAGTAAARELKTGLLLSKPRRAFGAPLNLVDAPAADLWASNTMEARPFKDANYDLKRMQLEAAIQAVPSLQDAAVQVCKGAYSSSARLRCVLQCHLSLLGYSRAMLQLLHLRITFIAAVRVYHAVWPSTQQRTLLQLGCCITTKRT